MIGFGYLFSDPSGDGSDQQHFEEPNTRLAEKCLRVFHGGLHKLQ
jgi:hypothetical protein